MAKSKSSWNKIRDDQGYWRKLKRTEELDAIFMENLINHFILTSIDNKKQREVSLFSSLVLIIDIDNWCQSGTN